LGASSPLLCRSAFSYSIAVIVPNGHSSNETLSIRSLNDTCRRCLPSCLTDKFVDYDLGCTLWIFQNVQLKQVSRLSAACHLGGAKPILLEVLCLPACLLDRQAHRGQGLRPHRLLGRLPRHGLHGRLLGCSMHRRQVHSRTRPRTSMLICLTPTSRPRSPAAWLRSRDSPMRMTTLHPLGASLMSPMTLPRTRPSRRQGPLVWGAVACRQIAAPHPFL